MKDWKEVFQHVDFCPWLVEVGKVSLRGKKKKRTLVRTAESGTGTSGVAGLSFSWQECFDLGIF